MLEVLTTYRNIKKKTNIVLLIAVATVIGGIGGRGVDISLYIISNSASPIPYTFDTLVTGMTWPTDHPDQLTTLTNWTTLATLND